jgi:CRISPR-associated protein Cmr2
MSFHLHFHLGPVQPFIGAARRTRDIWAGSFLLSWLTAQAAAAALDGGDVRAILSPASAVSDPMLQAVRGNMGVDRKGPFLGSFPNHFTIEFADENEARGAQNAAAAAVRRRWRRLADAVATMIFDTKVDGSTADDKQIAGARKIFDAQIGDENCAPMWEIYSIVVDAAAWRAEFGDNGPHPLAVAKAQRWTDDIAAGAAPTAGGFCSLLNGWAEVSGAADPTADSSKKARDAFWTHVRAAAVIARYGNPSTIGRAAECLDIRPNERLSAPALVKRLFPVLPISELSSIIGWEPGLRSTVISATVLPGTAKTRPEDLFSWFYRRIYGTDVEPQCDALMLEFLAASGMGGEQSPSLWPSTSAIAAAHWLERVLREAPAEAERLHATIEKLGRHIAVAEQTLFLKCLREQFASPLLRVDGAHLFPTSVERQRKAAEAQGDTELARDYEAVAARLDRIACIERPCGGTIGRPAPVYAVVRADGDSMGAALDRAGAAVSEALQDFVERLRGGADDQIGIIADNNAVPLYASADEMIAICPIEDALALATAAQLAFRDAFSRAANKAQNNGDAADEAVLRSCSVSVAVTFAHRQVPLSWVLDSGTALLGDVAKKRAGRNALALEILEAGGRKAQWVAPWTGADDATEALMRLVNGLQGCLAPLGSNDFLHKCADLLGPLCFEQDDSTLDGRIREAQKLRRDGQAGPVADVAEPILTLLVKRTCGKAELPAVARSVADLLAIAWTSWSDRTGAQRFDARLSLAGLKILRFLARNWRAGQSNTNESAEGMS